MAPGGLGGWITWNSGWIVPACAGLTLIALGLATWALLRLRKVESQYEELTRGTDGGSLQEVLDAHVREVRSTMDSVRELDCLARELERSGRRHMQRIGFLRFNPFRDAGGDQSFALALADSEGNGFVVSSLHSRDVTRVYGKPLVAWDSIYALTDEEKLAIEKARTQA
ncbi:MAG: DUF4446 family protein [Nitrososphaerales archaeon]